MLGNNLTNKVNTANQLFADWLNPSTGRRSRALSKAFIDQYQNPSHSQSIGAGIIGNLLNISNVKVEQTFVNEFIYGKTMEIWRKGKIKVVEMYVDVSLPNLLWVATKSKAFLFDMAYTNVNRFDLELQKSAKIKDYVVLHYFEESLPIIFRGQKAQQANKYYKILSQYCTYNKILYAYPPYFSRIVKLYKMQTLKDGLSRKKRISQILKVSELIGLTDKSRNRSILESVASKNNSSISDNTELNDDFISDYFKIMHCCEDMKPLFEKYSEMKLQNYMQYLSPVLTRQSFRQFLIFQQRQETKIINEIIEQTRQFISFYDFCSYLMSEKTNYAVMPQQMNQDLPLTDYFCYSSHNTYLSGNQLTSDSKIQRYIEDLQGGLKCVQIDVHNDGARPIITHALNDKSFCKPIDFEETIQAINRCCEHHPNHYPLIISVENHASDANRYKMLNILFSIFDKKLFIVNNQDSNESLKVSKTLRELKGKIIIKTDSNINEIYAYHKKSGQKSLIKPPPPSLSLPDNFQQTNFRNRDFQNQYERFQIQMKQFEMRKSNFLTKNPKQLYVPMAEMTKITGMFKSPTGIHNQQSSGYECTSLTNEKAGKSDKNLLIRYTNRSWLRIYPLGTEIASSNYNPLPSLRIGAQIIALNTQTKDTNAWLMMSYFTAGRPAIPGMIGYVPKPQYLREKIASSVQKLISIKVISNQQKVSIKFFGMQEDMKLNFNSIFDFHVKHFHQGFLMFQINNKFKQCLPLRFIRKGYRVLMAKNEMYRDSGLRILVLITIKQLLNHN